MRANDNIKPVYVPPQGPVFGRILNSSPVSVVLYLLTMGYICWVVYIGADNIGYNWQWYNIPQYVYSFTDDGFQPRELLLGLYVSLKISVISFLLALCMGLGLALLRLSNLIVGPIVARGFLELVRNVPLLVLIYLFYYVLGPIFQMDRLTAGILCLACFHAALISEILRAGILSVPKSQWEGAASIGMSQYQVYRYIILPQAVRIILPPMTGEIINLLKSSAIVSVIAVAELTTVGRNLISDTYMSFEIWFTVAAIYFVVTVAISASLSRIEKKYTN
ncbi:MAG: polar amino acid transport system permease protein [Granulosicoccus sp.]|jgi:polar amino acid transport system permease protein|tara:strand:- start:6298 stop:7131 length:834 start_codon:yes stop_codon:yes gene_type:complete